MYSIKQTVLINFIVFSTANGHDLVPVLEMVQLRRLTVWDTDPVPLLHSLKNRRDVLEELIFVIWDHDFIPNYFRVSFKCDCYLKPDIDLFKYVIFL